MSRDAFICLQKIKKHIDIEQSRPARRSGRCSALKHPENLLGKHSKQSTSHPVQCPALCQLTFGSQPCMYSTRTHGAQLYRRTRVTADQQSEHSQQDGAAARCFLPSNLQWLRSRPGPPQSLSYCCCCPAREVRLTPVRLTPVRLTPVCLTPV